MTAAIVAGHYVPGLVRGFANHVLMGDRLNAANDRLDGTTYAEINLGLPIGEVALLALRLEMQLSIEAAARHPHSRFAHQWDLAEELSLALWRTGNAEMLSWSALPDRLS